MARTKRWKWSPVEDGVVEVELSSWKYFSDFVNQELLEYRTFIYRGHASDRWKLEPSLERHLRSYAKTSAAKIRTEHLNNFKLAARGRRGSSPPNLQNDSDWWALGQHHGLATPLLDWTELPFIGLYFAFVELPDRRSSHRVIYALQETAIIRKSADLLSDHALRVASWKADSAAANVTSLTGLPGRTSLLAGSEESRRPPPPERPAVVEIIRPMSDENARLVSQRGLFVRCPDGVPLEQWIKKNFQGETTYMQLIKIKIPSDDREVCLRWLNRMNINHLSLFPDLYGASIFCNTDLVIKNY